MVNGNEAIRSYIYDHKGEMLELWEKIVNINSGSGNKAGVDSVCEVLAKSLEDDGISVNIVQEEVSGNTLVAEWNEGADAKPVILMGHMDTVFKEQTENGIFRIEGDIAKGHGCLDMKAGLVMAVYICKALKAAGYKSRPIKLVFAGDEETAHPNSNTVQTMGNAIRGAIAAFNFETGNINDGIVTGRLGAGLFAIETGGVSAHSGNDPEKGRSAIEEMAHKVLKLQALNDIDSGKLMNIGTILTEGKTNIIPDKCVAEGAYRFKTRKIHEELEQEIEKICSETDVEGTTCKYIRKNVIDCMEPVEANSMLFEFAKKVAKDIGYGEVYEMHSGGGSDASVAVNVDVPVICGVGVKGEFNHTESEYAVVESMFERSVWIANVINQIDEFTF